MFPLSQSINLNVDAISGISGSISIACWIVVFSPQIAENFRRGSADGLSIAFLIIWLSGDVFNILGAVLQGVLPTMIILAVYYTLADIVLLGQCFYYRGFTLKDYADKQVKDTDDPDERTGLLGSNEEAGDYNTGLEQSRSDITYTERSSSTLSGDDSVSSPTVAPGKKHRVKKDTRKSRNALLSAIYNLLAITVVCCAGVVGWWLSNRAGGSHDGNNSDKDDQLKKETLHFNLWGQIFGYICAALYLGSRVPQLLLNYRRKSTEGISLLFFLFACVGNLTYVLSIFAYIPICRDPDSCEPGEKLSIYGRYMLINLSWLLGSAGTLLLDASVFVQFFMYRKNET